MISFTFVIDGVGELVMITREEAEGLSLRWGRWLWLPGWMGWNTGVCLASTKYTGEIAEEEGDGE